MEVHYGDYLSEYRWIRRDTMRYGFVMVGFIEGWVERQRVAGFAHSCQVIARVCVCVCMCKCFMLFVLPIIREYIMKRSAG